MRAMSLQQENSSKQQQIASSSSSLSSPLQHVTIIPVILLIICIGVLLFPSYYSTDFDVHRNWLSITRHLPLTDWYFDNQQGQTVHTLDYPPTFAYFEAFLSNNYITRNLLEAMGLVDGRCFQILPDSNNRVSDSCIAFHRSTVIISYAVYFIAVMSVAKVVSNAAGGERSTSQSEAKAELVNTITMTLLIFNPGLIFLDFVHFQYNGLLLGILILSLSSVTHAAINPQRFLYYDIIGAVLFAFLLGMKHLYLSLAPLYFIYLLRHYCFIKKNYYDKDNNRCQMDKRNESEKENNSSSQSPKEQPSLCFQFSLLRFLLLSLVTLLILLLPYVPFFIFTSSPIKQMKQIFSRLFPFGRGLVHDYWAGNIWALYLFLSKGFRFLNNRGYFWQPHYLLTSDGELPNITPAFSAVLSLLSLLPALYCAYKVATKSLEKPLESPLFFLHATAYCSLCVFMLGYHVHEKAIMSTIIPLTLLATLSQDHARLYLRVCAFGHFGLFPLLYRPVETLFKISTYVVHLSLSVLLLETFHSHDGKLTEKSKNTVVEPGLIKNFDKCYLFLIFCLTLYMECIHDLSLNPLRHLEFLPLMATSVFSAVGLLSCWISLTRLMWKYSFNKEQHTM